MSTSADVMSAAGQPELYLGYLGRETDLAYTRGVELPGFASYPLLGTVEGRALLAGYAGSLIRVARRHGTGVLLDTCTWMANPERAQLLGHGRQDLARAYRESISLVARVRDANRDVPALVMAQVGPRFDGYTPATAMSAEQSRAFHMRQVSALGEAGADMVMASTIGSVDEAIGIVRAGQASGVPIVISFTLESDGTLADGSDLGRAVEAVDNAASPGPEYFLINCAHPDHIQNGLADASWVRRVHGVLANASRTPHPLAASPEVLDTGDAEELASQLAALRDRFPHFTVLGGCCGTSMTHMEAIAVHALGNAGSLEE